MHFLNVCVVHRIRPAGEHRDKRLADEGEHLKELLGRREGQVEHCIGPCELEAAEKPLECVTVEYRVELRAELRADGISAFDVRTHAFVRAHQWPRGWVWSAHARTCSRLRGWSRG